MAVLEVNNIEKHFGSTRVLKDVSFSLEKGNALAIIGSSGSGKTTMLKMINRLLEHQIRVQSRSMARPYLTRHVR